MKLYGSTTSPFVRRIRLCLTGKAYEFVNMDIFSGSGRELLRAKNPALKVPMLEDDGQMIFDSRVIHRYLQDKFNQAPLSWDEENLLTLIDAANDAFVQRMMLMRSGIAHDADKLIFTLQDERFSTTLSTLENSVQHGGFEQWNYPSMCLYCLLDWVIFRELYSFEEYPNLHAFWHAHQNTTNVAETDPRQ
ncbi:glutathione S-transferase family protein [Alteromonas gilva]|uniref:Glutathione S-transferase family protein n=1 Tax=Alteromonas gilva TaxID=2987522 RepID=A0ABT5L660_9ALTE|nr:glutathione S-transferase family protein [Alteromonas gilva]MDC8832540.1 glutathione S-transferase family protein [Alteromonas gilva]